MGTSRAWTLTVCFCLSAGAAAGGAGAEPALQAATAAAEVGQEVTGQVKDTTGGVLVRTRVTLRAAEGTFQREATTDARGRFRFQNVPPGAYVVVAEGAGFSPGTQELKVTSAAVTVDVTLSPATYQEQVEVSFVGSHSSALKTDAPVRDIPLSVQSYTNSFMKAIETTNLSDMYNYTIGVSRVAPDAYAFTIRGMNSQSVAYNITFNGMPGLAARFGSPSTENVERIEVLKGPVAALYGQAQPGGIINIVTKKPQSERADVIDIRGGSFFGRGPGFGDDNKYHIAADLTGPVDRSRKLLYRLVAAYDNDRTFRDFAKISEVYAVPSLSWMGWNGAVLNVEFEYRRRRTGLDNGLVAPANNIALVAPITTRYQEPDDHQNEDGKTASLYLNKLFARNVVWNVSWRSAWTADDTKGYENVSVTNFTLTRRDRNQINARRYHYLDTTIRKPVHTGSVEHHLLFGINGGYELNDFDQRQFNSLPSLNVNIYAPVYGAPNLPPKPGTHQHFTFNNQAAYLTDQIDLGPQWKALAGLRATRQTSDFQDLRATPVLPVRHGNLHAFLPLAGLVFQPNATWSLYSSFSTSFNPVRPNFVDVNGEATFKPERGRQIEAGAKTSLAHGRGEASLALFNITRTGVILSLTTQFPNAQQIGQERSRGLELSVSQRILNNWQAILGYGYTDAHITQDLDPRRVGARTQNVPRHNGNLWTRYDVAGGALRGLGFGLGLVYSGERAGTLPASNSTLPVLSLPSYFRIDAGLYYVARRYELTARVVNLRDEFYYESSSALGGANQLQLRPGAPRAATLSLRCKF